MNLPTVIIIGGGFGGLNAAKELGKARAKVILIDKTNHHLFQPLLYQVAGAALDSKDIAYPIREIFKHYSNTSVMMDEVIAIDKEAKKVSLLSGEILSYDYLIVAIGSHHSYFGRDEWAEFAPGMKTLSDAIYLRQEILMAYERAEGSQHEAEAPTFVIVGGGPTGVEMAGAIAEMAHRTLVKNFRKIDPSKTKIYLIEGTPHLLPVFPLILSERAKKDLEGMGVEVITNAFVTKITEDGVYLGERLLATKNVIWAAGNRAPRLMETIGTSLDPSRRAIVESDLSIPGFPELFVIGDCAQARSKAGNILPGIAPVAIQQGKYVAKIIKKNIAKHKRKPFRYLDKGALATIGKAKAVGIVGKWKITGFFAWLAWSFIHIFYLVGFRNRLIVMLEWAFWYITGGRGSRLIY